MNFEKELKQAQEDIKTLREVAIGHQQAIKNLCTVIMHLANGTGVDVEGVEDQGSETDYYADLASRMTSN